MLGAEHEIWQHDDIHGFASPHSSPQHVDIPLGYAGFTCRCDPVLILYRVRRFRVETSEVRYFSMVIFENWHCVVLAQDQFKRK